MPEPKIVLDEDDIRRTLVRIAHEVVEKNSGRPVALVGIHRRGAHLATRLHQLVCDLLDEEVPLGDIDIAFYRDDLGTRGPDPHVNASNLEFRMEDYTVVLVDDVLYTGPHRAGRDRGAVRLRPPGAVSSSPCWPTAATGSCRCAPTTWARTCRPRAPSA